MVRHFKKTICFLFGAAALVSLSPSPAKAQHIVTETEAGKLTLESLTAAPAVRHYKARKVSYKTSSSKNHSKLVRNVSYKQKGKLSVKNAVYKSSSHKKTAVKHRHRS
ncbi:unnamed protein product [Commensalibacter communis]|uniref:hypothetical protein n=1 Tax=Commensalibacter communis TaxID=2972786 RepID=UPI0022FF8108|nr:hypothetical protein [Commensalibacter communis]CAI3923195.1 unnamed protein product [Commensalibacter communis]CAI3935309.1 unnamed protein product [Commensalibacter communis]CAI3935955.1 unnamed protein product [Commensalibacter communis]